MTVEWDVHAYKARLDAAIAGDRWDEADRIRIAAKRRLIEVIIDRDGDQVEAARDALADSFQRTRLSKRVRIEKGALATATKLLADGETAGIATTYVPATVGVGRDARESILLQLNAGNRRPMTTSELAERTGHRAETVARIVSQLRADGKIVSRRMGRHVLHRPIEPSSALNRVGHLQLQDNERMDTHAKESLDVIEQPRVGVFRSLARGVIIVKSEDLNRETAIPTHDPRSPVDTDLLANNASAAAA